MCVCVGTGVFFFFFKQKTAYEMRISDWSSDVCSSDLLANGLAAAAIITLHMEISLEGLPYLAIFGALFAVDWLRDPRTAPRLAGFTGGLALFPWAWLDRKSVV